VVTLTCLGFFTAFTSPTFSHRLSTLLPQLLTTIYIIHTHAMSSAVGELENYLQSMLALKPPGVSGTKIQGITTLCTANVQVREAFPR
jgi:hypothetical protein